MNCAPTFGCEGVINRAPTFHIHQADGLTLPWEPCVDLFLANPPYLAAKNNNLSIYQSAQQRGQTDSYLLFLDLALQVVRPNGWIGLVLPDPVLARANAIRERRRLLEEFTLHHLWHLSGVFAAEVGAVVLIAQKRPPHPTHVVSWARERWRKGTDPTEDIETIQVTRPTILQALLLQQPGAELRYLLSSKQGATSERLHTYLAEPSVEKRRLAPLKDFLSIRRGEELGKESSCITQNIIADADGNTVYSRGDPCGRPDNLPVLRGGIDVRPYILTTTNWSIARDAVKKPLERYLAPKLLVVKSTHLLQAALDMQGHVVLQTLYLLYPHKKDAAEDNLDSLYFFLALLNSRLLREYVYVLHTAYKWVQPQIEQSVLARLPIPIVRQEARQEIIERAKLLLHACGAGTPVVEWGESISTLYEEQERAIHALYDAVLL